jgi:hypothetical protein
MRRFALLLSLTIGCGQIVVGEELPRNIDDGDGKGDGKGNGMGNGMGNGDGMGDGNMNNMPACTNPPIPTAWPYAKDKQTYLDEYFNQPEQPACVVCHDALYLPYMPKDEAELDDPMKLQNALKIWERAIPVDRGGGDKTPAMLWRHVEGKGGQVPYYSAQTLAFLEAFVTRGSDCMWAPVIAAGATALDPMMCEPPAIDLSYCAE